VFSIDSQEGVHVLSVLQSRVLRKISGLNENIRENNGENFTMKSFIIWTPCHIELVEMVHGRITAGETTVFPTAAVLRCGKQMEELAH
jgi:hypothetical protein